MDKDASRLEFKAYMEKEVIRPLYEVHIGLRQIRLPMPEGVRNTSFKEEPLINSFISEEVRKYITPKENRDGSVFNTIGHACVLQKTELEEYMKYDVKGYSKDDLNLAQKLMVHGCDPLPRRRCLTRSSKPYPINESLWEVPDGRNVKWNKCQTEKKEAMYCANL